MHCNWACCTVFTFYFLPLTFLYEPVCDYSGHKGLDGTDDVPPGEVAHLGGRLQVRHTENPLDGQATGGFRSLVTTYSSSGKYPCTGKLNLSKN